jgi:hypothetical protein
MHNFLEIEAILPPEQFGFRKQHNTMNAVQELLENISANHAKKWHLLHFWTLKKLLIALIIKNWSNTNSAVGP